MAKRIFFFILTNILVLVTISIILSLLGIGGYINEQGGLNMGSLLAFSAVIGFTGAFISLAMSRWMAKKMMNVQVLDPHGNLSSEERELVEMVDRLSKAAGLMHMPEVGIYDSPEVNAFATGPSKKRSLVAVSTGLLDNMDRDAVEGVVAHEVAHIANGDMVTMTLLQGVVNTFVVFLSRIAAWAASRLVKEELAPIVHFIAVIVFQIAFSILGSMVVMAYSRYREYHADRGGADLAGKDKMVHALQSLKAYMNQANEGEASSLATLKISSGKKRMMLFSSHPDLDDRIQRLQAQ
ncbi:MULTISPECIES: protease HtpX [Paenibacillus]|uniref:Protease HtpX homolog n=1 Tax=Paenibacillus campinasensis TaxID=66347 RepID=A0A268EE16_9BACL|nr:MULTISPECIES: protease HtpX [Paenibacillus]MUG68699.1 protease HtpX [Paenibacillus campinasensis]PAD71368.1 zinc metalloprotease HtpX [Paenibacillus campinasensis]PAK50617.1 zinc metalloprotease HtpX [Paenibacillus sp. 7541]